jgi:hypothetical protein
MSTFYTEPTTGTRIATDVIGSDRYQIMKLDIGTLGSSVPLTGTAQFGALVDVSRIQGSVDVALSSSVDINLLPTAVDNSSQGTLTAVGQTASTLTEGCGTAVAQLAGAFAATVQFEGTAGSSAVWFPLPAVNQGSNVVSSNASTTGQYIIGCAGLSSVRIICSAYTSGSVNVVIEAGAGSQLAHIIGLVNQGVGNAAASPWSVSGTVTAVQGTSPWLVSGGVSLGSPLPPGANIIGKVSQDTSPWVVSGGVSIGAPIPPGTNAIGSVNVGTLPNVNQGTGNAAGSPWSVSGQIHGIVASAQSVTGVNPLYVGMNSGGAIGRFLTAVVSTRNTSGDAILAVGPQVYDSGNNLYRDLLGDNLGRAYVNQGIGNAAGSPWSVSGSVSITNTPTVNVGTLPNVNQGTGNAAGSPWAVSGTVSITNTPSVNQGTNPWVVGGTAASGSVAESIPVLISGADIAAVKRTLLLNNEGSLPVGGFTKNVSTTLQRTNNSTTYTANTAVANATGSATQLTFAGCARNNGYTGFITSVFMVDCQKATTLGQFELWLFDTSLSTVIGDNIAWAPVSGDLQNLVGIVPLNLSYVGSTGAGGLGNVVFEAPNLNIPYKCGAASTSLFGQLVVRNAYVPIPRELFIIRLQISQD